MVARVTFHQVVRYRECIPALRTASDDGMNENERAPRPGQSPRRFFLPVALLVLALAGATWFSRPDGQLRVHFLNTPGDAILIQTPRGGYVLIDGGSDPALLSLYLGRRMPFWQRRLEAIVLTQADHGRLPGQIAALARYNARLALAPSQLPRNSITHEWLRLIRDQRTPIYTPPPGSQLNLGGATITILVNGSSAESGLVLRLDYGATSVILCGAGSAADDAELLANAGPVTVLAYPWQRDMLTPLVQAWQPEAIVFTSAYEAERPVLLTMHERAVNDAAVYHEKVHGTVVLISDGQRAWIEAEKQS